jgi:hypothetical protein
VLLLLVGVHRAAEHDQRVGGNVLGRRPACRQLPAGELVALRPDGVFEDAGADARAVRECEDTHGPSLASVG